jgi:hypothetical protein
VFRGGACRLRFTAPEDCAVCFGFQLSRTGGERKAFGGRNLICMRCYFWSSYHQELNLQLFVLLSLTINLSHYLSVSVSWIHPSHFVFLFCICVKQDLICIAIVKNILGHGRVLVCPRFVVAIKSFLVGVSPSKTRDKDRLFCQLSLAPASPTWMFTIENQLKSNGESFQTVTYAPACNLSFRSVRT